MTKLTPLVLVLCSFSVSAMTNDCKIAVQMFNETGTLISQATEAAKGKSAAKLSQSKITAQQFNSWLQRSFSPRMSQALDKYSNYQSISSESPIFLGNVLLLETNNYVDALKNYMSSRDDQQIQILKEVMARINTTYSTLKKDCEG